MKKLGLLAGICGAAAFGLASAAGALPLGPSAAMVGSDDGIVQLVHGCHSDWREDRFGLHRHSRDCRRIEGDDRRERRFEPPPPRRECYYVGPVRVCP
jgi:hypothetical protein